MQIDEPPENAQPEQSIIVAPASAPQRRQHSWSVLGHRNYALLFWGQLISSTGTQMQIVAVAWQVFLFHLSSNFRHQRRHSLHPGNPLYCCPCTKFTACRGKVSKACDRGIL